MLLSSFICIYLTKDLYIEKLVTKEDILKDDMLKNVGNQKNILRNVGNKIPFKRSYFKECW